MSGKRRGGKNEAREKEKEGASFLMRVAGKKKRHAEGRIKNRGVAKRGETAGIKEEELREDKPLSR